MFPCIFFNLTINLLQRFVIRDTSLFIGRAEKDLDTTFFCKRGQGEGLSLVIDGKWATL